MQLFSSINLPLKRWNYFSFYEVLYVFGFGTMPPATPTPSRKVHFPRGAVGYNYQMYNQHWRRFCGVQSRHVPQ